MQHLAARAGHDADFLRAHQQRLRDMWHEVVAVKLQADSLGVAHGDLRAQFVRCRCEMLDFRVRLHAEMQALRASVDDLGRQLDGLPSAADLDDEERRPRRYVRQPLLVKAWLTTPEDSSGKADCSGKPPQQRIHEAIQSTRRWYRDHKTTGLSDAAFVANYLRQQSKRDPAMAVLLQKALQRLGRRRSRPRSLDDLCRDLAWSDVTDIVKAVLVRDTEAAARAPEREDRAAAACQARR